MQCSTVFLKVTKIPINEAGSLVSLHTPRYSPLRKMNLSSSFDTLNDKNRFIPLEIIFKLLSGYAGKKQYRFIPDLSKRIDDFKELDIDWHCLKAMNQYEVLDLFSSLELSHTEKSILLTALQKKVCGVLCQSSTRHSNKICFRTGIQSHGWRCGVDGHFNDVYFEGKGSALKFNDALVRCKNDSGVSTVVKYEPDLSIIGRYHDIIHPRVWRTPENPIFSVEFIGYEFRVHPNDPRVRYQIEGAYSEWEMHAQITKQIIWEMLEMYATECDPQPLSLKSGEIGLPDSCCINSRAFSTEVVDSHSKTHLVEYKMNTKDGREIPWFMNPLPQKFENGIPLNLPYAPSIVVKSSFKQLPRSSTLYEAEKNVYQPLMDISIFIHPKVCFFWTSEDEQKCIDQILNYAKRMPYALPFYLYFRVDSSHYMNSNPEIVKKKAELLKKKEKYFNLRYFSQVCGTGEQNS